MMKIERCWHCDATTGGAELADDSLYDSLGNGPYCPDCWHELYDEVEAEARAEALEEAAKVCDHSEAEYAKLTKGKREAVDELWACQQEAGALAGQIRRLAQPAKETPHATD